MDLVQCPAYKSEISPNATACPRCGEPRKTAAPGGSPGAFNLSDPVHAIGSIGCLVLVLGMLAVCGKTCWR